MNIMTSVVLNPRVKVRKPLVASPVFNRVWEDFLLSDWPFAGSVGVEAVSRPPINMVEGDAEYRIEIAAPGLTKRDFKIGIDKDILTVSVEKEASVEGKEKVLRREFSFSNFQRSFRLPNTVQVEGIRATYENGILLLTLPKSDSARVKPPVDIKIA
jgi:HSP20 family protein